MRSRILHLADLHLGDDHSYLGSAAARRRSEADGLLGRIADFVLSPSSGVGGVVIAGDLFDLHDPPLGLVESVLRDLGRLADAGIRLLTVPGNHDEYSYTSCVFRRHGSRWPGDLVTRPAPGKVATWNLDGHSVDLYAMAFVAGRSQAPHDRFAVEPGPARKIAVLHGSLDVDWSDRSLPLRSSNLAELGLDYVALGHIHKPMERRLGRGWACYPGRIEGGGFADPGGAGLVTCDAAGDLAPRREAFASRRIDVIRWDISGLHREEELAAKLEREADPERILRVHLDGLPGFSLGAETLERRWADRFYHLELISPEREAMAEDLETLAAERTVRGIFAGIAAARIAEAADEDQRQLRRAASRYGLAAFGGEVSR